MALGTITSKRDTDNRLHAYKFTLGGDGAYPPGATAAFNAALGTKLGKSVKLIDVKGIGTGYHLSYDYTADKLKAWVASTGAEVANAVDLSGVTFDCIATYE